MGFIEGKLPLNLVLIVDSFIKTLLNVEKLINLKKTKCKISQFSLDYSQFLQFLEKFGNPYSDIFFF